jgi:hypothetical protein
VTASRSSSPAIVGGFQFSEAVNAISDADLRDLRAWGVNTLVTEGDTYSAEAIRRVRDSGMRFIAGLSAFSDHANGNSLLQTRPELHPIDETGRPRRQMEWYVGITPTIADYRESRARAAEAIVREHEVDGLMLDFVRWPLHWELELRPDAPPSAASSFDPVTLDDFVRWRGEPLPAEADGPASAAAWILRDARDEWTSYRCAVITAFVEDVARRVRAIRRDVMVGAFVVPLPPAALADAVGQDVAALGQVLDLIAPMTYHAIVHRDAAWVADTTEAIAASSDCRVVPVVQVDSADGPAFDADWGPPVTPEEWREVADTAWEAAGSLIAFPAGALAREGRGAVLAGLSGKRVA